MPSEPGRLDHAVINHFRTLIDELLDAGIAPIPTLFDGRLPDWLQHAGGWHNRAAATEFAAFADVCGVAFGDQIETWFTFGSALSPHRAPGQHASPRDLAATSAADVHHRLLAHGLATQRLRSACPDADIGVTVDIELVTPNPAHARDVQPFWHTDRLAGVTTTDDPPVPSDPCSSMYGDVSRNDVAIIGSPIDILCIDDTSVWPTHSPIRRPSPLSMILGDLHRRYDIPHLMVTSGSPSSGQYDGTVDKPDADGLSTHLQRQVAEVLRARTAGVPVIGYLISPLFDETLDQPKRARRSGLLTTEPDSGHHQRALAAEWFRALIEESQREVSLGARATAERAATEAARTFERRLRKPHHC